MNGLETVLKRLEGRLPGGLVSFGTAWEKGAVRETVFALYNEDGTEVPCQSAAAAFWPDGSVKWARHTADSALLGGVIRVEAGRGGAAPGPGIRVEALPGGGAKVDAGRLCLTIPGEGQSALFTGIRLDGKERIRRLEPYFLLQRETGDEENGIRRRTLGDPVIREVAFEERGDTALAVLFKGVYLGKEGRMPFEIRFQMGAGVQGLKYQSTLLFDGDENRDRIAGLGLRMVCPLEGESHDHHVMVPADGLVFHEPAVLLESRIPRTGTALKERQYRGEAVRFPAGTPEAEMLETVAADLPEWDRYDVYQKSADSAVIEKNTGAGFCRVPGLHFGRWNGVIGVATPFGGVLAGLKDAWQRWPSGARVSGLAKGECQVSVFFYSPDAPALDLRHYDGRSYPNSSYEGFEYFGASPYGIAVTSEGEILPTSAWTGEEQALSFAARVQKGAVYTQTPEELHRLNAFGPWSLPTDRAGEKALEEQLDRAVRFYREQVEERKWYGFLDYGDFRHSYDSLRHTWKYDIGGFAWQNTELVPTYWLWLAFLRTGREDVWTLAEAMSRHASEVDSYHLGPMKGIGSRHNVRHWGCPCKEPRVSMAGHHRPMYYLLGDRRIGQCLADTAEAQDSLPAVRWYSRFEGKLIARSGPDWTSLLSNWMCAYERTLDPRYLSLAEEGIRGIMAAPMGMGSGTQFRFEPSSGKMTYDGDQKGNVHLTLCFGALNILLEAAEAMGLEKLKQMCAEYGRLYMMTEEERAARYGKCAEGRGFTMRYVAAGIGAYAGAVFGDPELKKRAWHELLKAAPMRYQQDGLVARTYAVDENGHEKKEIPWISTNYISQWCLNVIMILAFAPEAMPGEEEVRRIFEEAYRLEL